jgi:glutamate dehydrogenase
MRWFLQYDHQRPISECLSLYRPVTNELGPQLPELLVCRDRLDVTALLARALDGGVPGNLARTWAELRESFTLLDIARVHQLTGRPLKAIALVYYAILSGSASKSCSSGSTTCPVRRSGRPWRGPPFGMTCPPPCPN